MKATDRQFVGGLSMMFGLAVFLWLVFAVWGCSAPTAPSVQSQVESLASRREVVLEDSPREIARQVMTHVTVFPPAGETFPTDAITGVFQTGWSGRTCLEGLEVEGSQVGWTGSTTGSEIIVAQVTPDSITVWASFRAGALRVSVYQWINDLPANRRDFFLDATSLPASQIPIHGCYWMDHPCQAVRIFCEPSALYEADAGVGIPEPGLVRPMVRVR